MESVKSIKLLNDIDKVTPDKYKKTIDNVMELMLAPECEVCGVKSKNIQCPSCSETYYCSVKCYKEYKDIHKIKCPKLPPALLNHKFRYVFDAGYRKVLPLITKGEKITEKRKKYHIVVDKNGKCHTIKDYDYYIHKNVGLVGLERFLIDLIPEKTIYMSQIMFFQLYWYAKMEQFLPENWDLVISDDVFFPPDMPEPNVDPVLQQLLFPYNILAIDESLHSSFFLKGMPAYVPVLGPFSGDLYTSLMPFGCTRSKINKVGTYMSMGYRCSILQLSEFGYIKITEDEINNIKKKLELWLASEYHARELMEIDIEPFPDIKYHNIEVYDKSRFIS
jgi:hypothetical protein